MNDDVGKIKSLMFAKEVHADVCGGQEQMSAVLNAFDVVFAELATVSLVQASSVSRLRNIQSSMKHIRVYSVTVHGLNVILNRMGKKANRERAALNRECQFFRKAETGIETETDTHSQYHIPYHPNSLSIGIPL